MDSRRAQEPGHDPMASAVWACDSVRNRSWRRTCSSALRSPRSPPRRGTSSGGCSRAGRPHLCRRESGGSRWRIVPRTSRAHRRERRSDRPACICTRNKRPRSRRAMSEGATHALSVHGRGELLGRDHAAKVGGPSWEKAAAREPMNTDVPPTRRCGATVLGMAPCCSRLPFAEGNKRELLLLGILGKRPTVRGRRRRTRGGPRRARHSMPLAREAGTLSGKRPRPGPPRSARPPRAPRPAARVPVVG